MRYMCSTNLTRFIVSPDQYLMKSTHPVALTVPDPTCSCRLCVTVTTPVVVDAVYRLEFVPNTVFRQMVLFSVSGVRKESFLVSWTLEVQWSRLELSEGTSES
jgi:hypothetical protein